MSIKTEILESYTIESHPNKEAVFTWIRNNWHDLAQHYVEDMIESLNAFAKFHSVKCDYSISSVPDRGEYIKFSGGIDFSKKPVGDCPLTGMCYDYTLIEADSLADLEHEALKEIHAETDYLYSEEGLYEMCEANGYYFLTNGSIN
jgi:hypothetical protein